MHVLICNLAFAEVMMKPQSNSAFTAFVGIDWAEAGTDSTHCPDARRKAEESANKCRLRNSTLGLSFLADRFWGVTSWM
jgi:hypothetical protein